MGPEERTEDDQLAQLRLVGPDGDPDAQAMWLALRRARTEFLSELSIAKMLGPVDAERLTAWREAVVGTPLSPFTTRKCAASWELLKRDDDGVGDQLQRFGLKERTRDVANIHRRVLTGDVRLASEYANATIALFGWLDEHGYTLAVKGKNTGRMKNVASRHRIIACEFMLEAHEASMQIRQRIQRLDALHRLGALNDHPEPPLDLGKY